MIKTLASKIYGKVVGSINKKHDDNEPMYQCKVPVISVGNLTVGGTGKTPFVQMLTKFFLSKNIKVGIIGRGYKKDLKGEVIVSDGENILATAEEGGDEMLLLAQTLKVPVIAHEKKYLAAKSMEEKFDVNIIIVDDGFQHRNLHRDIDILLLDRETVENPELIPKGKLREPLDSMARADVICLAGISDLDNSTSKFITPESIIIKVKPINANPYELGNKVPLKYSKIKEIQESVLPFAGIAKPDRFFDMLVGMNYKFASTKEFSDHHKYSASDIQKLISLATKAGTKFLATTEKDATKLSEFKDLLDSANITCYVFPIALTIWDGKNQFFKLLNSVIKVKK
ncbi:MAG: tetraacyldisaccharide 4'-kinase [Desulfobulbaceae bacterium]|nr:tetraacyldisaccharide 4'-kinase [Candidatus Kapabacteria bacterium]MBS4001627.1 tetraacyldisaccharide 4'-kinase [Desulfobulbaceae bacterium]